MNDMDDGPRTRNVGNEPKSLPATNPAVAASAVVRLVRVAQVTVELKIREQL